MLTKKELKAAYNFHQVTRSQVEDSIVEAMFSYDQDELEYDDYENELSDKMIEKLKKSGFKIKFLKGSEETPKSKHPCDNCDCEVDPVKTYLISWK